MFYLILLTRVFAADLPCHTPPPALDWAQFASTQDLRDKAFQPDLGDISPLLGYCDESTHLDRESIIAEMRRRLKDVNAALGRRKEDADYVRGGLPDVRKEDHAPATKSDFLAIDIVARTLFSEIGTQPNCDIRYVVAVGCSIMNRADTVAQPDSPKRHRWARPLTNDIDHPLVDIVLSPGQYDVWNPKLRGHRTAMCPAAKLNQFYKKEDKNGKVVISSTGLGSNGQWMESVGVAAAMVLRDKQFHEMCQGMTAASYTSGERLSLSRPEDGYHPVEVKLKGKPLKNDFKCVQFWDDPVKPTKDDD